MNQVKETAHATRARDSASYDAGGAITLRPPAMTTLESTPFDSAATLPHAPRRRRILFGLALACVLLMLVVVGASAWLRLAQPRPLCLDWPGCRDSLRPALPARAAGWLGEPAIMAGVRAMHRVAASAMLPVLAALAWMAWARRPRESILGRWSLAMLGLAFGLAALGVVTPGSRSPVVLLGNLIGGQLLLALAWTTLRSLRATRVPTATTARWALAGAALWALQSALGALSGAGFGEAPAMAHLALAMFGALVAMAVAIAAAREGCADGWLLLGLVVVQLALGAAAVAAAALAALVLLHNVGAALGLATMLALGEARRR